MKKKYFLKTLRYYNHEAETECKEVFGSKRPWKLKELILEIKSLLEGLENKEVSEHWKIDEKIKRERESKIRGQSRGSNS